MGHNTALTKQEEILKTSQPLLNSINPKAAPGLGENHLVILLQVGGVGLQQVPDDAAFVFCSDFTVTVFSLRHCLIRLSCRAVSVQLLGA